MNKKGTAIRIIGFILFSLLLITSILLTVQLGISIEHHRRKYYCHTALEFCILEIALDEEHGDFDIYTYETIKLPPRETWERSDGLIEYDYIVETYNDEGICKWCCFIAFRCHHFSNSFRSATGMERVYRPDECVYIDCDLAYYIPYGEYADE